MVRFILSHRRNHCNAAALIFLVCTCAGFLLLLATSNSQNATASISQRAALDLSTITVEPLFGALQAVQQPALGASKQVALVVDNDNDGVADPGDVVRYTVVVSNTGDMDALTSIFSDTLDANTTFIPNSVETTPLAYNQAITTSEESAVAIILTGSDADGDTLTFSVKTPPTNGNLSGAAPALTYTPNLDFFGTDSLDFQVCDTNSPVACNADRVNITVTPVDDAPIAVNDVVTVSEDAPLTLLNVLLNDLDVDGGAKSIASVTQPLSGTVTITNNGSRLTYQPLADYCNDPPIAQDSVTYSASPGGSNATVTIFVTCVDDAPIAANDSFTISEDVLATTLDLLNNDQDIDGGARSIASVTQPVSGTVTIINSGASVSYQPDLNYCNDPPGTPVTFDYTLTPGSSSATVSLTVTCIDDLPLAVDDTTTLNEDAPATVIDVLANDIDIDGGLFTVTAVTQPLSGTVVITNSGAALSYQPNADACNNPPGITPDTFTYSLTPGGSSATVAVTVECINDAPTTSGATFAIAENSSNGASVGTVTSNDVDAGQSLSFAITGGNAGGAFSLNSTSGELTVANSLLLNFEVTPTITLTVQVSDDGIPSLSASATITVNVTDLNETAQVDPASFTLPENSANGSNVGSITFSDPDGGQTHTFSITAGNVGNAFAIHPSSGQISVTNSAALDFEATPVFTLTVQVSDDGTPNLAGSAQVVINLSDVNERPVVDPASFSIAENSANGTNVGSVTFSDPDGGQTHTFSITAGNTGNAFAINPTSGQINVTNANALNFETTPTFSLTVEVGDDGAPSLTGSATVIVNLTDGNETPIVNPASFGLPENSANGTSVGSVTFSDVDSGQSHSFLITAGNTGNAFAIDAVSGQISVTNASALNFETTPTFTLTVQVTDSGAPPLSGSAQVVINLSDRNETPVVNPASFSLPENSVNGTNVGTVTFSDPDVGQSHTFSIAAGNTGNAFAIDPASGQISVTNSAALDFETTPIFTLTVQVTDNGSPNLSGSATATIQLTDANDAPVTNPATFSIAENSAIATSVGTVIFSDVDAGQTHTFAITGGNVGNAFALNGTSGELTVATPAVLNFEATPTITLVVQVSDNGAPVLSSSALITVNLTDINETPVITAVTFSLAENSANGTNVGTVSAADVDAGQSLSFAITAGNTGNAFAINPVTGQISVTNVAALDFETTPIFTLTVEVSDNGLPVLSASASVTVNLTNADDPPVAVNDSATVNEDSTATAISVLSNDTDLDGGTNLITTTTQPANGTVVITGGGTGLTYQPNPNYCNTPPSTTLDSFSYTLTPGGSSATVTVTVTCIDDAPVAVADSATVSEDSGTTAINVLANDTDVDGGAISITSVTQPGNGTVVITGGGTGLTYAPNANYCNTPPGTTLDTFTYTLTPGGSTTTVSLTVTCVDDPPVAVADSATVNEDAGATAIAVLSNDTDIDGGTKSINSVAQPANGTVVITGGGTGLTYQPNANYCNNPPGTTLESFTYSLTPGSSTATVTVTVTCLNDAPVADADSYGVNEGATLTVAAPGLLDGDSDIENDPLTAILVTTPLRASAFTLNSNGSFNYTHDGSETLTDSFTYKANDGLLDSNVVTVSLTITPVNDAPVVTVPGGQSVNEDTNLVFSGGTLISVSDADVGPGTMAITLTTNNGTITLNGVSGLGFTVGDGTSDATMSFTGTLTSINSALNGMRFLGNANFNATQGAASLTITSNDRGNSGIGGALSDSETVAITVNAVNDPPSIANKNFTAQTNMQIDIGAGSGLLNGASDPDAVDVSFTPVLTVSSVGATTPSGGNVSFTAGTGAFSFNPPPGITGNVGFTYTVCDNGNPTPSLCSTANVTFNVSGPVIWFVNPAAGVNGDGRLSSPFNNLTSAIGVDAANHRIFLYSGTANVGITLNTGEWLIGQGVTTGSFDSVMGISPPSGTIARPSLSGTRPTVQGQVTMATNGVVRGLNITPASSIQGLSASSATGLTVGEVNVTASNAAAVNLVNSDGTFSFTRIDANGGSNGIVWNNASPATGSFSVTGSGTTAASGGVISNMTGADITSGSGRTPNGTTAGTGVFLSNATSVTLANMQLNDFSNFAIFGDNVAGFTLTSTTISGVNGENVGQTEGSIRFRNLTGSASILSCTISGAKTNNFAIENTSGTLNRIIVTGTTFGSMDAATGDHALLIESLNSAVINSTITNNIFTAARGTHINRVLNSSAASDTAITGNNISNSGVSAVSGGGAAIRIFGGSNIAGINASATFTVSNNTMRDSRGTALAVSKLGGNGIFSGIITNNTVGVAGVANSGSSEGSAIFVLHDGAGSYTASITDNTVHQYNNYGIYAQTGGSGVVGSGTLRLTITGNNAANPGSAVFAKNGIHLNGGVSPGDTYKICLTVGGAGMLANSITGTGTDGGTDFRLRQRQSTTVYLAGYGGANNDDPAVVSYVQLQNGTTPTGSASNTVATGGGGFSSAACP